jgi:hypothetical protein
MGKTYGEQIAEWRTQRQQQQAAERVHEIRSQYAQVQRERDRAIAENDMETAEWRDYDCQQLEEEYKQYTPQQPPQLPQGLTRWAQRNPRFFERYGLQASAAIDGALAYMMRPKNPQTNRPDATGMGMSRDKIFTSDGFFTPQGREVLESLLQMHGPSYYGVSYDPGEKSLTWQDAAKNSNLSQKDYISAYNELKRQGRVS